MSKSVPKTTLLLTWQRILFESKMNDIFQDTAFGRVVRFVTRGKVFGWEEYREDVDIDRYMKHATQGEDPEKDDQSATDSAEAEKGLDYYLVDWLENDPKVRRPFWQPDANKHVSPCHQANDQSTEPSKLVIREEGFRNRPDMPLDNISLHRYAIMLEHHCATQG